MCHELGIKMKKTRIDIISGFLGAGKTTFIKKLMEGVFTDESIVILENEFGKINIDQETLGREGLTVKPIQAGCICCSSSIELSKGILEIIEEFNPDRIIVEPTGIAKLSEIKKLLAQKELEDLCETDLILTIVDGKNYYIRTMISKDFFEDQIRASEIIFISKTDLMDEKEKQDILTEINKINPNCHIITDSWISITADRLRKIIEMKKETTISKQQLRLRINHVNDFESFEIVMADSITITQIRLFIKDIENNLYGEVHRLKGICSDPGRGLYSVEYVPSEINIKVLADKKSDSTDYSELCLIGRKLKTKTLELVFKQII